MAAVGERIASTVDSLRRDGYAVERRVRAGEVGYVITGASFHIDIAVNPDRWVGLHLGLGADPRKPTLTYDIDTDGCDLAHPRRFEAFARSVEGEIVTFLEALATGRVMVGKVGRSTALLVPMGTRAGVVTRGRFRGTRIRRAGSSLEAKGGFVALT